MRTPVPQGEIAARVSDLLDKQFVADTTGLTSAQIDALFASTPAVGTVIVDTVNHWYLQRETTKWYRSAALTLIA